MRDTSSGGWRATTISPGVATTISPGVATPMGPGITMPHYIVREHDSGLIEISD